MYIMNKIFLICVIWTTIFCATGGQLNGDPAPGRSPGPPAQNRQIAVKNSTTTTSSNKSNSSIATATANAMLTTATTTTSNNHVLQVNDVLFNTDYNDDDKIDPLNDNQESSSVSNTLTNNNDNNNNKLADSINNVSHSGGGGTSAGNDSLVTVDMAGAPADRVSVAVEDGTISAHVQTELPSASSAAVASSTASANRKSCNSASNSYTRHEYLNAARTHNQKIVPTINGGVNIAVTTTPSKAAGKYGDVIVDGNIVVATHPPSSSLSIHFDVTHDVYDIDHGLVNNVIYVVHFYTPKNESVTDFYIESLVDNVSAGKFMSTDSGYAVRRSRPNDDSGGNGLGGGGDYDGQQSKQYGNEKTAWSQQHTYPLNSRASSAGAAATSASGRGLMRDGGIGKINSNAQPPVRPTMLRVDESGIEFVESSSDGTRNGTATTTTSTMSTTTTIGAKTQPTAYNKNVNKRRKRVDNNMNSNNNNNNNDNRHCTEPMWMAYGVDGIEHNVRRWMYNATSSANKTVSFRIYYRTKGNSDVNEITSEFKIRNDCKLYVKDTTGILDHNSLPNIDYDLCTIYFPSRTVLSTEPPGLLVQLTRLNVPCDNGGYIIFTDQNYLCGKLEDLDANERTYYFPLHQHTNVVLHKKPLFSLTFKLVDYCYNMTLIEQNNSILLEPKDVLECYFKIHLPYGNQIELNLYVNLYTKAYNDNGQMIMYSKADDKMVEDGSWTNIDYELIDLNASQIVAATTMKTMKKSALTAGLSSTNINRYGYDCQGIFVQVLDIDTKSWRYCVYGNTVAKRFMLKSTGNSVIVRISRETFLDRQGANNDGSDGYFYRRDEPIENHRNINKALGKPSVFMEYRALPIAEIVSQCAFGWVAVHQFCITAIENALPWTIAEGECKKLGGHLASIKSEREQRTIDALLLNSVAFTESAAYWVGASDEIFEGDFRWSNGFPYTYSNWFPGWSEHNNYNKQPNDDGLSAQDCVELRRYFRVPPTIQSKSKTIPLALTYMWNDRDCNERNYYLCERPMSVEPVEKSWTIDCNKTVVLTRDHPRASVWSPGFPRHYPDKANCFTVVIAPKGYQIVIDFEELVIESEPECSYDYLEIIDTHYSESNRIYPHNSRHSFSRNFNSNSSHHDRDYYYHTNNNSVDFFQNFLGIYKEHTTYLIQTPDMNQIHDSHLSMSTIPRRICGDWNSKIKLLRRVSNGPVLGLHFSSDYSHHFGGYKAKVSIKNVASDCSDDRLKAYNGSCYLFVSYPEVDWSTAQQICSGIHGELTSIATPEEQRFVVTSIRNQLDYSPQAIYWIGAQVVENEFKWLDETEIAFKGWVPGQEPNANQFKEPTCVGLQWKMSPTQMLPSGLFWSSQPCKKFGGYACKKKSEKTSFENGKNYTVTGLEGEFTSPNFPKQYPVNIDYWVKIIGPKRSRIVIQFHKIDLEEQADCLYDYVRIQDNENYSNNLEPGESIVPVAMFTADDTAKGYQNDEYRMPRNDRKHHPQKRDAKTAKGNSGLSSVNVGPTFLPYVRWCGAHESNLTRFDFISATNVALVNFHSDYSITGNGFALTWKAVDVSGCPTQTFASNEMTNIITSPNYPNFLLNNLDCTYNIYAPTGRKVWLEFTVFEVMHQGTLEIDIGNGPFVPFRNSRQLNDGVFVSFTERMTIRLRTGFMPKGKGFRATFKTMTASEHRSIHLLNNTYGTLYHLNYPQPVPPNIDFTQHLIAPLGDVILLELYNVGFSENGCQNGDSIEIYDNYADNNGTYWSLCELPTYDENSDIDPYVMPSPIHITSYLNTLHIRQKTTLNLNYLKLNATIRIQPDFNYKYKLATGNDEVESCHPNPCQYGGKCMANGNFRRCQCVNHFTGRFCGLTMCEVEPCFFGKCELTPTSFKCHCQPGYIGRTCDQKQRPCADNPCESRGECFEKNGKFHCRCHAWWEGARCEKRMLHIPYKPLSERMLQEPFWLGLITVFVVMAFIGLVWCAKRHFPEKIEKLLAEEAERNRPTSLHGHHLGHHHPSLREQLQFTITNSAPQSTATTPGAPRTIFGRLGIRKPSILSLSSPQAPGGATARTFSLDDLLRPPPRRTPSPRKKRNNSTPTKKNAAEKKQILQQLISPAVQKNRAKMSLDDLMLITDNRIQLSGLDIDGHLGETTFSELNNAVKCQLTDPKLEKKVTFARLMSKVTAELSSGSEVDAEIGTHTLASLNLPAPNDPIPTRPSSVPPTPSCTHEIRSPHSTSSNQGSDSLSGSEQTLNDTDIIGSMRYQRRIKPKVSSADSILAMFRNFASTNVISHIPSSMIISPSTTPSASSPQDDDESSTSSMHTSCAPDSPISSSYQKQHMQQSTSIEVPVIDSFSAHKTSSLSSINSSGSNNSNLLNPPSILLEIPSNINKCLSPIRELPTPIPSPALTPNMPRYHRFAGYQTSTSTTIHSTKPPDTYTNSFSDDDERITIEHSEKHPRGQYLAGHPSNDASSTRTDTADIHNSGLPNRNTQTVIRPIPRPPTVQISIDVAPPSNELRSPNRPKNLVIPQLVIQQASPTKERLPIMHPGSPPPHRQSVGETNFFLPNVTTKSQQKRHLKDFDKPASLELPFAPPMITITANMAELESDADTMSPINIKASALGIPSGGMCYLSPFSIVTRGDRTTSEGNLSSSGYSSMASPGTSRCGSSNPLCPNEMDDSAAGHSSNSNMQGHKIVPGRRLSTQSTDAVSFASKMVSDGQRKIVRRLSDSETLSDDMLLESNDEGIETDHIDEKIEDGIIKSAKELEIYIGKELVDNGKNILMEESMVMSQLQLPSIVIQGEATEKGISPVSSRSESPISERATSLSRFSPLFYNRKQQQLPFTDSDGLYDFPSSDGKGNSARPQHSKKSSIKKRDRKSSRGGAIAPSPTRSILLDIPFKDPSPSLAHSTKHHHSTNRKSPKRRPIQRAAVASSSSSTESLASMSKARYGVILREKKVVKQLEYCAGAGVDTEEDVSSQILPRADMESIKSSRKLSRLRAIGNQIRFLRRIEKSIKRRQQHHYPHPNPELDSFDDDESDIGRAATSPLLKSKLLPISSSTAVKANIELSAFARHSSKRPFAEYRLRSRSTGNKSDHQ